MEFEAIVERLLDMAARPPVGLNTTRLSRGRSPRRRSSTLSVSSQGLERSLSRPRVQQLGTLTLQNMWLDMLAAAPDDGSGGAGVPVDCFVNVVLSPGYVPSESQHAVGMYAHTDRCVFASGTWPSSPPSASSHSRLPRLVQPLAPGRDPRHLQGERLLADAP